MSAQLHGRRANLIADSSMTFQLNQHERMILALHLTKVGPSLVGEWMHDVLADPTVHVTITVTARDGGCQHCQTDHQIDAKCH